MSAQIVEFRQTPHRSGDIRIDPKKVGRVRFHRNGIMGAGFFTVEFLWRDEGERCDRRMLGTVFASDDARPRVLCRRRSPRPRADLAG